MIYVYICICIYMYIYIYICSRATLLPPRTRAVGHQRQRRQEHDLVWNGKMWVCSICLFRTSSVVCHYNRPCVPKIPLDRLLSIDRGHKLWSASCHGGGTIVYCTRCWHYASAYPRKLLLPCSRPKLGFRPCAKFHLSNRRHPVRHSRLLFPARLHIQ